MNGSIISWEFWDLWLQKFFVQLISVKVLSISVSVVLCIYGLISGAHLATIFGIIFGVKGAFQVAHIVKNGRLPVVNTMIDKV